MSKTTLKPTANYGYSFRGHGRSFEVILRELVIPDYARFEFQRLDDIAKSATLSLGDKLDLIEGSKGLFRLEFRHHHGHYELNCYHSGYTVFPPKEFKE